MREPHCETIPAICYVQSRQAVKQPPIVHLPHGQLKRLFSLLILLDLNISFHFDVLHRQPELAARCHKVAKARGMRQYVGKSMLGAIILHFVI
ncbi:hypothetical protein D1872_257600 [compost metagenome]